MAIRTVRAAFCRTAKANSLAKHLKALGIVPSGCSFQMVALGPFFPEQETLRRHRRCRDQIAAVEARVAERLKARGFAVLGNTTTRKTCAPKLLRLADDFVAERFPKRRKT